MKPFIIIFPFIVFLFVQHLFAQTKADTIHVSHYDIYLEIGNFAQQEIHGYTDIHLEAKIAPVSSFRIDLLALTVDSIKNENISVNYVHQGQHLQIDLPLSSVGETEIIRIYYHGKPVRDPQWGGFFFDTTYHCAYNMGVGMGSIPHSFGRVWFPCMDDFNDKSTYTFNITTDADKKAICGGMLTDSVNFGNKMLWKWELSDPIPTYLASVAVGRYKAYKDTVQSITGEILPVEIYADSATLPKVPGSFVNLKTFIHTYEKRWGACYWQRVGYVAVPFRNGAMEHATNIAYPRSFINGNTNDQDFISHELAHFWFGNLITCSTSQNMWINEGFARYGEYLCYETLDPSLQKYKSAIRTLHMDVLNKAHTPSFDGDYLALDNVPPNLTYGMTSYDKGGLVVYTLRNYMGDETFFSSITRFLDENKYGNVDSEEFFDKLSDISGMELHDFYLGWVHQPGFLNFNIDSVKPLNGNKYQVAFKQRLHHAEYFANNNLVDVEFVSATGERFLAEKIRFSGAHETVEIELPFEPVFWAIDPNFAMGDACYDYTHIINKPGTVNWGDACFKIEVAEILDESILRVEHNHFAPTLPKNNTPDVLRISEKRFWRVGFLKYNTMQTQYSFAYDLAYDKELMQGCTKDNLALLYRKDAAHDWQIISTTVTGTNQRGSIIINELFPGEYTLCIRDNLIVNEWEDYIEIYPNPTKDELSVFSDKLSLISIEVFDVSGRKQNAESSKKFSSFGSTGLINISHLSAGVYFLKIETEKGNVVKKIVKN